MELSRNAPRKSGPAKKVETLLAFFKLMRAKFEEAIEI